MGIVLKGMKNIDEFINEANQSMYVNIETKPTDDANGETVGMVDKGDETYNKIKDIMKVDSSTIKEMTAVIDMLSENAPSGSKKVLTTMLDRDNITKYFNGTSSDIQALLKKGKFQFIGSNLQNLYSNPVDIYSLLGNYYSVFTEQFFIDCMNINFGRNAGKGEFFFSVFTNFKKSYKGDLTLDGRNVEVKLDGHLQGKTSGKLFSTCMNEIEKSLNTSFKQKTYATGMEEMGEYFKKLTLTGDAEEQFLTSLILAFCNFPLSGGLDRLLINEFLPLAKNLYKQGRNGLEQLMFGIQLYAYSKTDELDDILIGANKAKGRNWMLFKLDKGNVSIDALINYKSFIFANQWEYNSKAGSGLRINLK